MDHKWKIKNILYIYIVWLFWPSVVYSWHDLVGFVDIFSNKYTIFKRKWIDRLSLGGIKRKE